MHELFRQTTLNQAPTLRENQINQRKRYLAAGYTLQENQIKFVDFNALHIFAKIKMHPNMVKQLIGFVAYAFVLYILHQQFTYHDQESDRKNNSQVPEQHKTLVQDETRKFPIGIGEGGVESYIINNNNNNNPDFHRYLINDALSAQISLHRSLDDYRSPQCIRKYYKYNSKHLPSTSVLLCFHNEPLSVLLRSVHSILDRSPSHLIHEIILCDDRSTYDNLGKQLEMHISHLKKVKLVRSKKRLGIMRIRNYCAAQATATILTFLDSHIECTEGWLEPLLERVWMNKKAIVSPIIDGIDAIKFYYKPMPYTTYMSQVPTLDVFRVDQKWDPDLKILKQNRDPLILPSPTMCGGLFSINREWFNKLGKYDPGLDIWGGEQIELALKGWMCGGRLEIHTCSRVGHVFRSNVPYDWRNQSSITVLLRNTLRVAVVWMDEAGELFRVRAGSQGSPKFYGNLSEQIALRKSLKCKSFRWFRKNVQPEMEEVPKFKAWGELRLAETNQCLDSTDIAILHTSVQSGYLSIYTCHKKGINQFYGWSETGNIIRDYNCLIVRNVSADKKVFFDHCHKAKHPSEIQWTYNHQTGKVIHVATKLCLTGNGNQAIVSKCNPTQKRYQTWKFELFNITVPWFNKTFV